MKKIIAPIDFSTTAENAAVYAASLAEFYGASLWLYHTYEITIPVSSFGYPLITPGELHNASLAETENLKKRILGFIKTPIEINIIVENSVFTSGLYRLCEELDPDLVVMGITGKTALARLVAGSNTIKVIHHIHYPVLVIPPKALFVPIRKIGFACDYEKVIVTQPIEPLKKLVHDFNAALFVLNIVYADKTSPADNVEATMNISEILKDLKPEFHTILTEDVVWGINYFADKQRLDLIAVLPRKHNIVEILFARDKTKDLLYHTHLPVLCIQD
jgi:nucleotide-binding universal stress UspA family protein